VKPAIAGLLLIIVVAAGCGGPKPEPVIDPPPELEIKIPERLPYRLAVGDVLLIKFFYYPAYSLNVTVRPDGVVTIPLVGEVAAEGMRPSELETLVRERYGGVLAAPEVSVIVIESGNQRFFVFGEVINPGAFDLKGSMTLLDAIGNAGGFHYTAQPECVVLMRKTETGEYTGRKVDVEGILESEKGENIYITAGDVIYVPKSTIAKIDFFVDQFFAKLSPAWQFYILGREVADPEGRFLFGS
jgi:protein involved in polysaccharide export with SLBB domain